MFAPCASGSLQAAVEPGHFVIPDQLVDQTSPRVRTFFEGPTTFHATFADPSAIALVTDYDAGVPGVRDRPVSHSEVLAVLEQNVEHVREVLIRVFGADLPTDRLTAGPGI